MCLLSSLRAFWDVCSKNKDSKSIQGCGHMGNNYNIDLWFTATVTALEQSLIMANLLYNCC